MAVWQGFDQNPVDAVLAEALARFGVYGQAGPQVLGHALGNAEALRTLVAGAGFRDVTVYSVSMVAWHVPSSRSISPKLR